MKKYKTLDKTWKEILFSAAGFGPNLLMILMGAFFSDAVNPGALNNNLLQTISGTCLVTPAAFAILMALAKAFDGIVDVPLAALTEVFYHFPRRLSICRAMNIFIKAQI